MSKVADNRVLVAQIGAPHGVRGEVRIRAFTEDPEALVDLGRLETEDGASRLEICRLRQGKGAMIAVFKGVTSREAAEALKNRRLYVPRDRLPTVDEDEYYHVDLVGLQALDLEGDEIGTVIAVQDFGAGDLLEVRMAASRRSVFVPFTRDVIPIVDVPAGRLTINAPEGLLDEPGPNGKKETDAE